MNHIGRYLDYVLYVKRYSERTARIYETALRSFYLSVYEGVRDWKELSDEAVLAPLNHSEVRSYEAVCIEKGHLCPKTVNLHLSVLSGFCSFLVKGGVLASNPVKLVKRPKVEKRLPEFYRREAMDAYFEATKYFASDDALELLLSDVSSAYSRKLYSSRLARLIVLMLYSLGLRRSELIGLNVGNVDFGRRVVLVSGKGNKSREVPLIQSLCEEMKAYSRVVEAMSGIVRTSEMPMLVTLSGNRLYPVYVDRVVKGELGGMADITGRKSPHVLRHSIATELLDAGTDINSIKELLGHSSLAATQVYTHNSIAKLRAVYDKAHPRSGKEDEKSEETA